MPKILITASRPSVYGAGRMAALFAFELQRSGHEVQFAYMNRLPPSLPSIVDELKERGIVIHHLPKMSTELLPGWPHSLSHLIQREQFDIVLASQLRDAGPAMAATHRNQVKGIVMAMNLPNFSGNFLIQSAKRRIYKIAVAKHADHVIVVAPAIEDELIKKFGVQASRITVVHCGLDIKSIPPVCEQDIAKLKVELGLKSTDFVAVNLARIHRQKGQDVLLEALGLLRQAGKLPTGFRMIFVGGSEDADGERLLQQHVQSTKRLGLDPFVKFVGFREDYRHFLYVADTFILPSRWEGLPLVVLEAFAAKVPVIMTEYGKRFENFGQDIDGVYVPNESPAELASAIEKMMARSITERQAMGTHGFDYLQAHLTLQSSLAKFSRLIDQILGSNNAAAQPQAKSI